MLAGDPLCSRLAHCLSNRFNPRPPLLAGDPRVGLRLYPCCSVSIRARHCWRAILHHIANSYPFVIVSIRARHCWRAIPHHKQLAATPVVVSIRARHCWRAIPATAPARLTPPKFQSAPAIAGGRSPTTMHKSMQTLYVSIRARHCWRAIPTPGPTHPHLITLFQSAPAIAGGRSLHAFYLDFFSGVFQSAPAIAGGRSAGEG